MEDYMSSDDPNVEKALREKADVEVSDGSAFEVIRNYPSESQDELDLHGHTKKEALIEIDKFVQDSIYKHVRIVRIITGQGRNSKNGRAVLFPATEQKLSELKKCDQIVAFKKAKTGGYFDVCL